MRLTITLIVCFAIGYATRAMQSQDASVLLADGWTLIDREQCIVTDFDAFTLRYAFDIHGYYTKDDGQDPFVAQDSK